MSRSPEELIEELKSAGYPELPNDRQDPLWKDLQEECKISLADMIRLKNYIFSTAPTIRTTQGTYVVRIMLCDVI